MKFVSNLKIAKEGVCMSWPVYILHALIYLSPLWIMANDKGLDEFQKSVGLPIVGMLVAFSAFVEKLQGKRDAPL